MTLPTIIYLAGLSEGLQCIFSTITILTASFNILLIIILMCNLSNDDRHGVQIKLFSSKCLKIFIPICVTSMFLIAILPSEKTVYMMIGAQGAKELYSSETGQKVLKLINEKIDQELTKGEKK